MTEDLNKVRATALAWLGKQEYSEFKFRQKLAARELEPQQIDLITNEFIANNWLSEQRYCEAFVRGRVRKGQGLLRIRNDGRAQGLDENTLAQALSDSDADWFEVARETYRKRFGEVPPTDIKDKAKRLRFMQYRGFNMDQINYAMSHATDDF